MHSHAFGLWGCPFVRTLRQPKVEKAPDSAPDYMVNRVASPGLPLYMYFYSDTNWNSTVECGRHEGS